MAADAGHGDRSAESQRILERVARDSSLFGRTTGFARDHFAAADADQNDWIEVWGTRIGRTLGILIVCVLIFWAVSLFVAGA
ncbi:hypothetical protein SAZ10_10035 [Mesorhizobium sp. BAC0120]|uniref:hypothetical protein n=1 Tax=Mesorhizobium sp. BAC0120 TaxID=3090670 RepID=UPI00298D2382|nr:hypothetical protein [Mesorhizobium sp. BAC0120]MDW6022102.1 hypothetical protein [Mesorhizobium sp. BAC0120]